MTITAGRAWSADLLRSRAKALESPLRWQPVTVAGIAAGEYLAGCGRWCWPRGWVLVRGLLAGVAGCRLAGWSLIGAIGEPGVAGWGGHSDAGPASSGVREFLAG